MSKVQITKPNDPERIVYRKGYDPEYWYRRAVASVENVSEEECLTWLKHPCTKALLYQLEANIASKVLGWMHGQYADANNVDATAQMQAKVIGQAQACDETIDLINEIGKTQFGEAD